MKRKKIVRAIVLAGGYSRRMKMDVPKQVLNIAGRPLLAYTLDVFEQTKEIDSIILVSHKKIISRCQSLIAEYGFKKVEQICPGGRTRQESVFNALKEIKPCTYVLVHDGVRPLLTEKIILDIIKAVKRFKAASCAIKATDTIVEAKSGMLNAVLSRDKLWQIQTPQAFRFDLLLRAHNQARERKIKDASDDAQLMLALRRKVKLVTASPGNIKVTTPADLSLLKGLMQAR
ncbi:MAG: 2-C-methyl-D-erythritol 4-phosphate cytidylyltransferase [Candidatus Omnitrophota bacterium]